jgi:hypothetical protein
MFEAPCLATLPLANRRAGGEAWVLNTGAKALIINDLRLVIEDKPERCVALVGRVVGR